MITMRTSYKLMMWATLTLVATSACSGPTELTTPVDENPRGSIEITTVTTGVMLDRDGYMLMIDEGRSQPIAINGSLLLSNQFAGPLDVELTDVAPNCDVAENPLSITVIASTTVLGLFTVTCT